MLIIALVDQIRRPIHELTLIEEAIFINIEELEQTVPTLELLQVLQGCEAQPFVAVGLPVLPRIQGDPVEAVLVVFPLVVPVDDSQGKVGTVDILLVHRLLEVFALADVLQKSDSSFEQLTR